MDLFLVVLGVFFLLVAFVCAALFGEDQRFSFLLCVVFFAVSGALCFVFSLPRTGIPKTTADLDKGAIYKAEPTPFELLWVNENGKKFLVELDKKLLPEPGQCFTLLEGRKIALVPCPALEKTLTPCSP